MPVLRPGPALTRALVMLRTLGMGAGGGALLAWAQMPLAWMIGAMLTVTTAALTGVTVRVPALFRNMMIIVLGVLLGSSFTPGILGHLQRWTVSLAGVAVYILAGIAVGVWLTRRLGGFDRVTAFFTAAPGGFNEMVLIGGAQGGDVRTIALCHSIRVVLVVFTIPIWLQLVIGYDSAARGPLGPGLAEIPAVDYALLTACALGAPIAARLRIPAAFLLGPMILSAAIHITGLSASKPPGMAIAAAQTVIGSYIGCRFAGSDIRQIGRTLGVGALLAFALLGVTVGLALILHLITGIGTIDLILAFAPGGLAEMSLIALALHADAAFVATHHILRIFLIILFAPMLFLLMKRLAGGRTPPPGS